MVDREGFLFFFFFKGLGGGYDFLVHVNSFGKARDQRMRKEFGLVPQSSRPSQELSLPYSTTSSFLRTPFKR